MWGEGRRSKSDNIVKTCAQHSLSQFRKAKDIFRGMNSTLTPQQIQDYQTNGFVAQRQSSRRPKSPEL